MIVSRLCIRESPYNAPLQCPKSSAHAHAQRRSAHPASASPAAHCTHTVGCCHRRRKKHVVFLLCGGVHACNAFYAYVSTRLLGLLRREELCQRSRCCATYSIPELVWAVAGQHAARCYRLSSRLRKCITAGVGALFHRNQLREYAPGCSRTRRPHLPNSWRLCATSSKCG